MTTPSIKGTVFASIVERIRKAIADGEISPARAERDLRPEDYEALEAPVVASLWYDIRSFARLSEFLRDTLAGGDDAYLVELGRESARKLLESGVNPQIQLLYKNSQKYGARSEESRSQEVGSAMDAMRKSIYNFTRWETLPDPDHPRRIIQQINEAEDFPDACIWRAVGFTMEMTAWGGASSEDLYRWRRVRSDLVQIYMTRDP